ncbi:aspartate dehydrogenase [Sporosarcina luteola]|uniref:aspartate dehydrogenase n=1 Tax=Sporosarcina luteola TaxID=582850 RepID=UPI002559D1FA|nr:aspartate dehydrogenase [Sporosarcina luteola]
MILIKIGLIGKGNLGTYLLQTINIEQLLPNTKITAILDEREKARNELPSLAAEYGCKAFHDIHSFLQSDIDIVVECSTIESAKTYALETIKQKDLLLISIGAFADSSFGSLVEQAAKASGRRIYLPSGAIGGLDVIKAAKLDGRLDSVTLTTRKPAHSLTADRITAEQIVFEGAARHAIQQFPKNANVAIVLSLAGIGVEKTHVRIIADPNVTQNIHHIQASGAFGEFDMTIKNNPSPNNPKTSHITGASILAALADIDSAVVVGS